MTATARPTHGSDDDKDDGDPPTVLVVGDFTPNLGKVERHVGPLARNARPTMVCLTAADVEGVDYREAPSLGWRPLGLCLMFLVAVHEAVRGDYDAVVSFSLIPHGTFALIVGRLIGRPAHVGVIGADLDVHAKAPYRPLIGALLRRFDVVSVPGRRHRRDLHALSVRRERTAILRNPVDADRYAPTDADQRFDLLWVGRFSPEKDPLRFVESCRALAQREIPFTAAMVGDGPQFEEVQSRLEQYGLADRVRLPGWVDEPAPYYRRSAVFALTSRRDALPLTLLEAMATGCVPVVPEIGNVADVAADGENAVVLEDRSVEEYAESFERLLTDRPRLDRLGDRATAVRRTHSFDAVAEDWNRILDRLLGRPASRPAVATAPTGGQRTNHVENTDA